VRLARCAVDVNVSVDEMNIEVAKLNDGDAEGSSLNAYVVLGPDVCGAGTVGTNEVFTLPHIFHASPRGIARSPHGVRAVLRGSPCGVRAFWSILCSDTRTLHGLVRAE
jgi:hypothetical protein